MIAAAGRPLCRHGVGKIRTLTVNALRLSSTEECKPQAPQTPQPPQSESSPSKPASSSSPPPPPPGPPCPPPLCPKIPDPNNPCNYCPPPLMDPDYPDLTKLKKLQCLYQKQDGVPIHLKKGAFDVYLYHATVITTFFCVICTFYSLYKMA